MINRLQLATEVGGLKGGKVFKSRLVDSPCSIARPVGQDLASLFRYKKFVDDIHGENPSACEYFP